jgi:type I restriction enzyme S subunit
MKLPKGWKMVSLGEHIDLLTGFPFQSERYSNGDDDVRLLRGDNIMQNSLRWDDARRWPKAESKGLERYSLREGDLVLAMDRPWVKSGLKHAVIQEEDLPCLLVQRVTRIRGDESLLTKFASHVIASHRFTQHVKGVQTETAIPHISAGQIKEFVVSLPTPTEQRKIADILTTWDEALTQLDSLIEAQERRKKALMQQLLTGRRRLKGFDQSKGKTASDRFGIYPADWKRVRLGDITHEVPTKNAGGTDLPVLSCTKHRGLVLSQEYFGKRVYAEDTSGYRVVQRGEFAYATNHIEEGSIGYQNLCDAGLVSPIYTVFKTTEAVDDSYLFRVLKSPLLIHFYQINTSASVDRRGSLRYDEFARIHIWLPSKAEQKAIAQVFDTADQQLTLLRTQRTALDQQKRGLMQRLLTGKLRVKI